MNEPFQIPVRIEAPRPRALAIIETLRSADIPGFTVFVEMPGGRRTSGEVEEVQAALGGTRGTVSREAMDQAARLLAGLGEDRSDTRMWLGEVEVSFEETLLRRRLSQELASGPPSR